MKSLMKTTALLALTILFCTTTFGQDLGSSVGSTPYDKYFGRVFSTLSSLGSNEAPLDQVSEYMRVGRGFRYYMKEPYVPQSPQETESSRSGDCKAKSLWVAYKMDDRQVRFVVGRIKSVSNMSHAWLLWKGPTGWLVLDPTFYSKPLEVARLGPAEFTPLYSYTAGRKFRHGGAAPAAKQAESKYGDHS